MCLQKFWVSCKILIIITRYINFACTYYLWIWSIHTGLFLLFLISPTFPLLRLQRSQILQKHPSTIHWSSMGCNVNSATLPFYFILFYFPSLNTLSSSLLGQPYTTVGLLELVVTTFVQNIVALASPQRSSAAPACTLPYNPNILYLIKLLILIIFLVKCSAVDDVIITFVWKLFWKLDWRDIFPLTSHREKQNTFWLVTGSKVI